MKMPLGGVVCRPLDNDPRGKTQIQLYIEADLGGNIPTKVQSMAIGWTAGGQNVFRKLIAGYLKEHPESTS